MNIGPYRIANRGRFRRMDVIYHSQAMTGKVLKMIRLGCALVGAQKSMRSRVWKMVGLMITVGCGAGEGRSAGSCSDGADNDGNGLFDCLDPGCTGSPDCTESTSDSGSFDTNRAPVDDGLWCPVAEMIASTCDHCHSVESPSKLHLDLETDPWNTLVGQPSIQWPQTHTLVVPGNPEGSLLYRKISGTQASDEGDPMPMEGALEPDMIQAVYDWIAGGSTRSSCD